ncbi:MAG: hemolysin family protein [Fimbriimonadaceae bacterium]
MTVLLIIIILVLINALYVAAEFATVSTRRSRVQQLAEEGNALAQRLLVLLKDPKGLDRYVATCQIGITASSLVLGAFGQSNLAQALTPMLSSMDGLQIAAAQTVSAVIVLVLLTLFQMILGELVPKSIALQHPTSTALATYWPIQVSAKILKPFIFLTNGTAFFILRLFGAKPVPHGHVHSAEELGHIISESAAGGVLSEQQDDRLKTALKLSKLPVRQLMTPRPIVHGIPISCTVDDAMKMLMLSPYTQLVAYEGDIDGAVGMVHTKDVLRADLEGKGQTTVQSLVRPAAIVPPNLSSSSLLDVFKQFGSSQAFVLDEHGGFEGLVTLEDVLSAMFGSIDDEFKTREMPQVQEEDGSLLVSGKTHLYQLEEWTGEVESPQAVTLGGYLAEALSKVPVVGDEVRVGKCEATIETLDRHSIELVRLRPIEEENGRD